MELNKTTRILFVLFFILVITLPVEAKDDENDLYRVETRDDNVFTGVLVEITDEYIVLESESLGRITIQRANIRKMTQVIDGKHWFENPQATRYLFAPNALGLGRGKGYYQNSWIFFNNINAGITDNFSIGAGMIPVFLIGVPAMPVWLLPKVSIPVATDKFHLAAGAMLGGVLGTSGTGLGGILYATSTIGDRNRNLSLGLGYGYSSREGLSSSPMLNISGMTRVSRLVYLVSENYFFPGSEFEGIGSIAIRRTSENISVDVGLVRPLGGVWENFIGIPWLGVTIPFGE